MLEHAPSFVRPCAIGFAVLVSGCAMPTDGSEDHASVDGEDIADTSQEITNGMVVTSVEYSGVVALQVWSTTLNSYWTFCSGMLMTNRKLLTAKHCLTDDLDGRTIYAKMGFTRTPVIATVLHPDWDVALARLQAPMFMKNWQYTGYLTNPPKVDSTSYKRSIYSGSNASLDGSGVACVGYGGATNARPSPPMTAGVFATTYGSEGYSPTDEVHMWETNSMLPEGGDSGMGCITGYQTDGSPVAVVQSGCFFSSRYCYGAGAEDWGPWARYAILVW
jgi:hypothetical protein